MSLMLTLAVDDLDRTATFYGDILGLSLQPLRGAAGSVSALLLQQGDASLVFRQSEALAACHPALFQHLHRHPRGLGLTLEFELPHMEALLHRLERCGVQVRYELQDDQHGRHEIWLHDADGYLLILSAQLDRA